MIALFKAEHDKDMRMFGPAEVGRPQGGWAALDRLETWIKTPTPVANI